MLTWTRNDGEYFSDYDRFCISKATSRIHSGDWELYDTKTKSQYWKPTLKECKTIAQKIIDAEDRDASHEGI